MVTPALRRDGQNP